MLKLLSLYVYQIQYIQILMFY
uniref:Uncharacterized protein n=1 Tax=Arundo donax TaxID=35708 RepID=A0A0A9FH63_ARUDO